jgi:cytochrome P450
MTFFSLEMRRHPYPAYAGLRGASPVFREPASGLWMLFAYDDVKRAIADPDAFGSAVTARGPTSQWLVFVDPPRHAKLRALVTRAFTPRAIAALEPAVQRLSRGLLDPLAGREELDLVAEYAAPLPLMVIATMLGAPPEDHLRFGRWAEAAFALAHTVAADRAAEAAIHTFAAATDEMRAYLDALLRGRLTASRDDLLSRLREASVDGERLTFDEILGFFQLLLVAGFETTTNLIANAVVSLAEHPSELVRLRASPALLPSAIEETLRYRSPVQAVFRVTRRPVALGNETIPAGQLVLPMFGAANRDPARFVDPDRFDVGRDPNPHLAFGHGIHFCVGAALARLEARVALSDLLARTATFELPVLDWEPRAAFHVHGPARLPVRFRR